jgi:hypothetical protein
MTLYFTFVVITPDMKTEIYLRHILLQLCPLWFCNICCNHLVNRTTVVKIVCAVKFVLILSKKFN